MNEQAHGAANAAVKSLLDQWVTEGREIGVQVAAYLGEELIVDAWAGTASTGRPVDGSTLFNAFSVGKAISVTALHIQAERCLIEYDAPVVRYWPEFAGQGRDDITVRQVITHRSGMMRMPPDVTPAQMCDWDYMTGAIAAMTPAFSPGSASGYQSMSFGWIVGMLVERTSGRDFRQFVREEIALPLKAPDLWLGLPESEQGRVAIMDDSAVSVAPEGVPYRETTPRAVELLPEPFGRSEVRAACIPAVGSIVTAKSVARLFAMLANGGQLDGVRLLSTERVAMFSEPRAGFADLDHWFGDRMVPVGQGGYWLGGTGIGSAAAPTNPRALCHPGMGGSLAFADPDAHLAVAFCHNRLCDFSADPDDQRIAVARAIDAAIS